MTWAASSPYRLRISVPAVGACNGVAENRYDELRYAWSPLGGCVRACSVEWLGSYEESLAVFVSGMTSSVRPGHSRPTLNTLRICHKSILVHLQQLMRWSERETPFSPSRAGVRTNSARFPSPFARPPASRLPRPLLNIYQVFALPPRPSLVVA